MKSSAESVVGARVWIAAVLDVLLIFIFVLIGRASHGEGLLGVLNTAWPFCLGLALGWVVGRVWRRPMQVWFSGVLLWMTTIVVAMLVRAVIGQGVQLSFVIVTTVVLGCRQRPYRWQSIASRS